RREIAADETRVGLADPRHALAGRHVPQLHALQAAVGLPRADERQVQHQYTPTATVSFRLARSPRSRTPSHGYSAHGAERTPSSRSAKRGMKNSRVSVVSRTRPRSP